jgi:hypothetical protein
MKYSFVYSTVLLIAAMSLAHTVSAQLGRDTQQEGLEQKKLELEKTRLEGDLRLREEEPQAKA